uniref:Uncharacterized protein n=1 Tax=Heterorhabditis bacteriophora TaxID=37862 RepID=A0A1I7XV53_HETBA
MPNLDERLAKCIEGAKLSESGQSKAKMAAQKKTVNSEEEANEIGGLSGIVKGWFWGKK